MERIGHYYLHFFGIVMFNWYPLVNFLFISILNQCCVMFEYSWALLHIHVAMWRMYISEVTSDNMSCNINSWHKLVPASLCALLNMVDEVALQEVLLQVFSLEYPLNPFCNYIHHTVTYFFFMLGSSWHLTCDRGSKFSSLAHTP